MYNATYVSTLTEPQFYSYAHQITAQPSLILLFVSMILIFLIVGMISVENKKKFVWIWVASSTLSLGIFLALYFLPIFTQDGLKFISDLLS